MHAIIVSICASLGVLFLILGLLKRFRHQWQQWLFWLISLALVITASVMVH